MLSSGSRVTFERAPAKLKAPPALHVNDKNNVHPWVAKNCSKMYMTNDHKAQHSINSFIPDTAKVCGAPSNGMKKNHRDSCHPIESYLREDTHNMQPHSDMITASNDACPPVANEPPYHAGQQTGLLQEHHP